MTAETLLVTGKWLTLVGLLITYTVYSLNYNYVFRKLGISQIPTPHPSSMLGKYTAEKSNPFLRNVAVRCFVVVVVGFFYVFFFSPTVCMLISEWNKVWKNEGNRSPARDRRPYIFSRRVKQDLARGLVRRRTLILIGHFEVTRGFGSVLCWIAPWE